MAIEAKNFKETDSGLEYIGSNRQQMGDGGVIAQIADGNGNVVAATDASWSVLVVHRAPLNIACERSANPDADCEFKITASPPAWESAGFDDSAWDPATEWSEAAVGPKDGYDEISWDPAARLIWGTDLKVDNTILLRNEVSGS